MLTCISKGLTGGNSTFPKSKRTPLSVTLFVTKLSGHSRFARDIASYAGVWIRLARVRGDVRPCRAVALYPPFEVTKILRL
jgi:hypothetical protein